MSTDDLTRPTAQEQVADGGNVRYGAPVWLIVDGREPVPLNLGRNATELMRSGHRVTVVIALPRARWTRANRLPGSPQETGSDQLSARCRELAAGLTDGGRVQVRVSRPSRATDWRRRWRRWSQGRAGSAVNLPAAELVESVDSLGELLGLTVEPLAARRSGRGNRPTRAAGNPR